MTKIEIIDETVAYYSRDTRRRAVKKGGDCCYYIPAGGGRPQRRCAVGRCMSKASASPVELAGLDSGSLNSVMKSRGGLDALLAPRYRGHSPEFWSDLQELHDKGSNWSEHEHGLTERGRDLVDKTKKRHLWEDK